MLPLLITTNNVPDRDLTLDFKCKLKPKANQTRQKERKAQTTIPYEMYRALNANDLI